MGNLSVGGRSVALLFTAAASGGSACGTEPAPPAPERWARAFDAAETGWLLSAWGSGASDLRVVGGAPGAGRVVRFDGAAWIDETLPEGTGLLNWIFGYGPEDVFAVGEGGVVLHFDGTRWREEPTPTEEDLWGVWGAGPTEPLWAVGGRGRAEGQATLLRREAGVWTRVELPPLQRPGVDALFKVWGSGPDDVFVVGQRGAVLRFDGAEWTEDGVGTSQDLIAVWGTGPGDVFVVGGRGNGVAARFDGVGWTRFDLGPTPGLNGVVSTGPREVWVAGEVGTVGRLDAEGLLELEQPPLTAEERALDFHAVFRGPNGLTAVGGNFAQPSGPYVGLAWQRQLGDGS